MNMIIHIMECERVGYEGGVERVLGPGANRKNWCTGFNVSIPIT